MKTVAVVRPAICDVSEQEAISFEKTSMVFFCGESIALQQEFKENNLRKNSTKWLAAQRRDEVNNVEEIGKVKREWRGNGQRVDRDKWKNWPEKSISVNLAVKRKQINSIQ